MLSNFKIDLSDTTTYTWKIESKKKMGVGSLFLRIVFFIIFPLIYFCFFGLLGLILPGVAKGLSIFFAFIVIVFLFILMLVPFNMNKFSSSDNPTMREIGSMYKGIYEFMKASAFTIGTSVLLYFLLVDYYSIGQGFNIDMRLFLNVILYYFENALSVLCLDIPSKFGIQLIDAKPLTQPAIIASVILNLFIGAGGIQMLLMFVKMRKTNEFTGTIGDCYYECGKYVHYVGFTNGKVKNEYVVELEGTIHSPETPLSFDINDFYFEAEKTSIL